MKLLQDKDGDTRLASAFAVWQISGDAKGDDGGGADREVHQESAQGYPWPQSAPEEQQGHQGDPGRWPDRSDLSSDEGQVQAEDCAAVVGDAQQEGLGNPRQAR